MPVIVDKSLITKVCVDDFALRKRYSYGTVMVNFETHRIVDIIESRETKQVEEWLKSYPPGNSCNYIFAKSPNASTL